MKSVCSSQRSRISRKWQTKWQSFSGRLSTGKQTETGKWRVESGKGVVVGCSGPLFPK